MSRPRPFDAGSWEWTLRASTLDTVVGDADRMSRAQATLQLGPSVADGGGVRPGVCSVGSSTFGQGGIALLGGSMV